MLTEESVSIPPIFTAITALTSKWAESTIDPTTSIMDPSWTGAGEFQFAKGWVFAKNDSKFLYMALDVVGDTGNDFGTGDYYWLSFDVDENKGISANKDVNYGPFPGFPNKLGLQKYLGPGTWTGISEPPESKCRVEFGPSPKSAVPHRIWKFKIALPEINATLFSLLGLPYTYFGFRVSSSNPAFTGDYPANFFNSFTNLTKLYFARKPAPSPALLGAIIGTVGLIPTSASVLNAVTGRATTTAGYFVEAHNAAFGGVLNFIANRVNVTALIGIGANKYRILHAVPGSASFLPLVSAWTNYRWNGANYVPIAFSANANKQYTLTNPAEEYSIDDLLIQFSTLGMDTGLHRFKVEFFKADGVTPVASAPQVLTLYVDNNVPTVNINSIKHGAVEVAACAIEKIGPGADGLTFNVTANDPEGNLRAWSFSATYGENQAVGIYSQAYETAVPPGNVWAGVQNFAVPTVPAAWRPPIQCAFSFIVQAWARTTNGYGYIGHSIYHRNLTLLV
ncbi:MAG TPA: hypothetical protein VF008_13475 [Niastella sp.]